MSDLNTPRRTGTFSTWHALSGLEYWSSGSGKIELQIAFDDARACNHPGPADADVLALSRQPYIAEQLAKLDSKLLAKELSEWGVWDETELADHDQNLQRILWLAACDIAEGSQGG
jgi:hypothetical protein